MRRGAALAMAAALSAAGGARALDGRALAHYAAGENAAAHGALEMAAGHFGKAFALLEAEGAAVSEDGARLLDEMARLALRLRDAARAERLLARSLAITAQVVGRGHPDYADRAARLARLRE